MHWKFYDRTSVAKIGLFGQFFVTEPVFGDGFSLSAQNCE